MKGLGFRVQGLGIRVPRKIEKSPKLVELDSARLL